MLQITGGKGFHLTFSNGWTLSVQFGGANYCDNYDQPIVAHAEKLPASSDAEIAAWHRDGKMIHWHGDTVLGHVPTDRIGKLIGVMANAPDRTDDGILSAFREAVKEPR